MTEFTRKIFEVTQRIPEGKVVTYKALAEAIGKPTAMRAVANALGTNEDPFTTPCHRVIRSDGNVGGYRWGADQKRLKLEQEGIQIRDNKVQIEYILTKIL